MECITVLTSLKEKHRMAMRASVWTSILDYVFGLCLSTISELSTAKTTGYSPNYKTVRNPANVGLLDVVQGLWNFLNVVECGIS